MRAAGAWRRGRAVQTVALGAAHGAVICDGRLFTFGCMRSRGGGALTRFPEVHGYLRDLIMLPLIKQKQLFPGPMSSLRIFRCGDDGQLGHGHGDRRCRFVPEPVPHLPLLVRGTLFHPRVPGSSNPILGRGLLICALGCITHRYRHNRILGSMCWVDDGRSPINLKPPFFSSLLSWLLSSFSPPGPV